MRVVDTRLIREETTQLVLYYDHFIRLVIIISFMDRLGDVSIQDFDHETPNSYTIS